MNDRKKEKGKREREKKNFKKIYGKFANICRFFSHSMKLRSFTLKLKACKFKCFTYDRELLSLPRMWHMASNIEYWMTIEITYFLSIAVSVKDGGVHGHQPSSVPSSSQQVPSLFPLPRPPFCHSLA